ncbi:hypothetical protein GGE45_004256 [Rhizobium aethiopicum]|uniref:Uncharacterized protein n=1 Tax=Rhizobium aethiopicum TaxID=1138170 RepID=A0A7W6Q8W5_9HYPH|nr:hypothetical protein [Rhizobium aethiopicum]MBB4581903.1 hypothetical protein [Rhizobium aethiopicum]
MIGGAFGSRGHVGGRAMRDGARNREFAARPLLPSGRRCRQADEGATRRILTSLPIPRRLSAFDRCAAVWKDQRNRPPHPPYGHLLPEGRRGNREVAAHLGRLAWTIAGTSSLRRRTGSSLPDPLPALRFGLRAFATAIDSLDRLLALCAAGSGVASAAPSPGPSLGLRAFATAIDSLDRLLALRATVAHPPAIPKSSASSAFR